MFRLPHIPQELVTIRFRPAITRSGLSTRIATTSGSARWVSRTMSSGPVMMPSANRNPTARAMVSLGVHNTVTLPISSAHVLSNSSMNSS